MRCVVRDERFVDTATGHDATATSSYSWKQTRSSGNYWIISFGPARQRLRLPRAKVRYCTVYGARLFRLENWTVVVRGRAMGRARLPCAKETESNHTQHTYCGRVTPVSYSSAGYTRL